MAGEWLSIIGRPLTKIIGVIFIGVVLGVYVVVAIGATILGASLRKH
jgi:hypothetical protein